MLYVIIAGQWPADTVEWRAFLPCNTESALFRQTCLEKSSARKKRKRNSKVYRRSALLLSRYFERSEFFFSASNFSVLELFLWPSRDTISVKNRGWLVRDGTLFEALSFFLNSVYFECCFVPSATWIRRVRRDSDRFKLNGLFFNFSEQRGKSRGFGRTRRTCTYDLRIYVGHGVPDQ